MFYGSRSAYSWWDNTGRHKEVSQGEGCEQGDLLAPALYALGQHKKGRSPRAEVQWVQRPASCQSRR